MAGIKFHTYMDKASTKQNHFLRKRFIPKAGECLAYPAALFRAREPVLTTAPLGKTACM
jgi:hypothetical protein